MDKRKGRITIGDDGHVIGSGGNVNAKECNVENRNGEIIGTTTFQPFVPHSTQQHLHILTQF